MNDLSKYGSNSHNQPEEPKRKEQHIQKMVRRAPTVRQPGAWSRIRTIFFAEDTASIKEIVLFDVVIPKIKDMLFDAVTEGSHAALYQGQTRTGRSSRSSRDGRREQYRRPSSYSAREAPIERERPQLDRRERAVHDFSNLVLDNAGEAEGVVDRMLAAVGEYGQVTVNDFYDAVGMTGDFTDDNYGWTNLRGIRVRKVRDGYIIELPRTQELD